MKIREVVAYGNYFQDFLESLPIKVQNKIFKIIEAVEILQRVPQQYLKSISGWIAKLFMKFYDLRLGYKRNITVSQNMTK